MRQKSPLRSTLTKLFLNSSEENQIEARSLLWSLEDVENLFKIFSQKVSGK